MGGDGETSKMARIAGESSGMVSLLIMSKSNYPLWSKRMQVHLEANGLWDAVKSDGVQSGGEISLLSLSFLG